MFDPLNATKCHYLSLNVPYFCMGSFWGGLQKYIFGDAIFAAGPAAFDIDAGVPWPLPEWEALAPFLLPEDAAAAIKLR